ncbi:hypothetical protein [Crenalkalicoccus roseus]|uniref:hypothetical protein n=1 Tax=Crenalkalicoccus roseus TaxID=1485588 RepID=UPI001305217C|nr:hypothetical protein [Crenalkalicoccus roseus]
MPEPAPRPPARPRRTPPRPGLPQRLLPWLDLIGKLLAAIATALAIWKGLG